MYNFKQELYAAIASEDQNKILELLRHFNLAQNDFYGQVTFVTLAVLKS